ncbi:MAG: GCN5-related N-acetyltransferase [Proteobacteria bacterium]|nr:GCN5-related N-acetyltransferase [Pseudomonadota bacterium]
MLQFFQSGSPADAQAAARLIHDSDPAYYDFWFGSAQAALSCLEKLWLAPAGSLSHAQTNVWREDGRLAVLVCHYPAGDEARLAEADTQAQGLLRGDLAQLQQREAMLAWLFPHLPADVWYLQTFAVSAERRGCGLGSQVLADIESAARAHGALELHTDVDSANPSALRFYQSHGFEIVTATRVPMLEPFSLPASFRMAKKLF